MRRQTVVRELTTSMTSLAARSLIPSLSLCANMARAMSIWRDVHTVAVSPLALAHTSAESNAFKASEGLPAPLRPSTNGGLKSVWRVFGEIQGYGVVSL